MSHLEHFLLGMWHNAALMAACFAILFTQLLKVPIHFVQHRYWDFHKVIEAGGMPSSHASGVVALSTVLGFLVGPKSPIFATAVVFSAIVLYDAGGIRRHAGEHAVLLNRLAMEMEKLDLTIAEDPPQEGERLKEILGHEPKEVVLGALLGVCIGVLFAKYWVF
jgi:uncharacterized protein